MRIYYKEIAYYPMTVLILVDIKDILKISISRDIVSFKELFKQGAEYRLNIEYAINGLV